VVHAKKLRLFAVVLQLGVILNGTAARAEELIVSAAASLTQAFTEAGKAFEASRPGTKVVFNFAASGTLLQQIDKGAPVDVFASADQETMDQAQKKGLIDAGSRKNFVSNRLVLAVPADAKVRVGGLGDLAKADVAKIAIGDPDYVPVGRYTRQSLAAAGLWESVTPKRILATSVRQVLDYLVRGEVDAGFVYATDAAGAKEKVKVVAEVSGHDPILYPIAVVAVSKGRASAQSFEAFLLSPAGKAILARYGFGEP
jgi:molybdate transport system substrate-binding protein